MINEDELQDIGTFTKPHGVKGEIELMTDFEPDEILDNEEPYVVCKIDNIPVPFFIDTVRPKRNTVYIIKIDGIDNEDDAKILVEKHVFVPQKNINISLDEMTSWQGIRDFKVVDSHFGEIGIIRKIDDSTINIVLQVMQDDKEILIPAAFVTAIDNETRIAETNLPDGFLDI